MPFKKGHKTNQGRKCSEEKRKHISETKRGKKTGFALNPMFSKEHRLKLSLVSKGKLKSEEHKKHLSESHKGKKQSQDWIEKRVRNCRGENHHNWKGGKSFEPYTTDWTQTLRRSIRERDCYICQICGKPQEDEAHNIHHIDYNKKNCNPNNFITLCVSCHIKTNYNRDYWTEYFKNL